MKSRWNYLAFAPSKTMLISRRREKLSAFATCQKPINVKNPERAKELGR